MADFKDSTAKLFAAMVSHWPETCPQQLMTTISLQRLARLLSRIAADALTPLDLTPAEFELLAALRSQPAPHRMTPTELYDAMLVSSGGLTKLLKNLEERLLVVRDVNNTDRRSRPVALTREGQELAERAMLVVQIAERPLHQAMEKTWKAEKRELSQALAALVAEADRVMTEAKSSAILSRRPPKLQPEDPH